jgi:serine/threonine protein kinase
MRLSPNSFSSQRPLASLLLLELCNNGDLGDLIYPAPGREQLQPEQMMTIAGEMAEGLAHLHSHSVKHLDM